jgi:hypothetical protein
MAVGHRAADAGVDLVEDERRRRAAIGQHHLQREHETRQFAARGHFHQRPGARARIGLRPELHLIDAVGAGQARVAGDLGDEPRPLQLQGRQFAADGGVEFLRRRLARLRQRVGAAGVQLPGVARRLRQLDEPRFSGVERGEIGGEFFGQRRQGLDRAGIFAPRAAQGEQPLLDALQLARIEIRLAQGRLDHRLRGVERDDGRVERLHRRLDQRRRLRRPPLQPAHHARQHGNRRRDRPPTASCASRNSAVDLLGLHHAPCAGPRVRLLLARRRGEARQLLMRMAQEIGVGARPGDARLLLLEFGARGAHGG